MNRVLISGMLGWSLAFTGCAPKEDPAVKVAASAEASRVKAEREAIFGAIANDPAIAWRSSGLGIKIITPGEGEAPKMSDRVRVNYVGKLKDGTVFDESRGKKKPSDFTVAHLMGGWAAAMSSLKPGGTAIFFIPPDLGYGSRKAGNIPADSGLIFEVELVAINPESADFK
jgi:FKBP-type peptidyl-prolyl cis-trans isomerase